MNTVSYTGEFLCDITDCNNLEKLKNEIRKFDESIVEDFLGRKSNAVVEDYILEEILMENNNDIKKSFSFVKDLLLVASQAAVSHSKAKAALLANNDIVNAIMELTM